MIYIFGSTGMLGRYVSTYLENVGYDVKRLTRNDYDLAQLTYTSLTNFLDCMKLDYGDVIINCAGIINQRGNENDLSEYFNVNSYFPIYLSNWKRKNPGSRVIHASTDCVFSGEVGNYIESDIPDATDIYGFSKAMGEPDGINIIRTSIIGEEIINKVSFFEFVRKNANGEINGFTNQIWNGITCLQWAKNIKNLIFNHLERPVLHFHTKPISKNILAEIINNIYNLNVKINPVIASKAFNKSLSTMYDNEIKMPDLQIQIKEMKEFKLR